MDVKNVFNILLLSISLATVFITLLTFIIFKIRNNTQKVQSAQLHRIEGVFFKRYAPYLEMENQQHQLSQKTMNTDPPTKSKSVLIYLSVVAFIATFLILENYLSFRAELSDKIATADSYKKLISSGLLKRHEFNAGQANPNTSEFISDHLKDRAGILVQNLKEIEFILYAPNNQNQLVHQKAVSQWEMFFKRQGLSFQKTATLKLPLKAQNTVYIIPQLKEVSKDQEKILAEIIEKKVPAFFTGPVGLHTKSSSPLFLQNNFGITPKKNPSAEQYFPAILSPHVYTLGEIPAGILLDLLPLDNEFLFEQTGDQAIAIRPSTYNGRAPSELPGLNLTQLSGSDLLMWSLLDPLPTNSEKEFNQRFYTDLTFITLLNQLAQKPYGVIHPWKESKYKTPIVLAIGTKDNFYKFTEFTNLIDKYDLSTTLFLVTKNIPQSKEELKKIAANFEFSSQTHDYALFSERSVYDNFEQIQTSRLEIEEITHKQVIGLRPPEETYDPKALNAIVQNKLQYIFGNQDHYRMAPYFLAGGELLVFPRTQYDDYNITQFKQLGSPDEVLGILINDLNRSLEVGGTYFLTLHTHIFTTPFYLHVLESFLKHIKQTPNVWATTFGELNQWWRARDQLLAQIKHTNGQYELMIENRGSQDVHNFSVHLKGLPEACKAPQGLEVATIRSKDTFRKTLCEI